MSPLSSIPEVDLEPVREELLVAVGARHLVWQAVLAELVLNDAVGGEHHVSLLQLFNAGLPLVAMVHNYLCQTHHGLRQLKAVPY